MLWTALGKRTKREKIGHSYYLLCMTVTKLTEILVYHKNNRFEPVKYNGFARA